MTDYLNVSASVIDVVTAAYSSSKALFETFRGIRDAPKSIQDLSTDLDALQKVLSSLGARPEPDSEGGPFSAVQISCLEHLTTPLSALTDACSELKLKLDRIACHSSDSRTSPRDRIKLQLQDKEITASRSRLASYERTAFGCFGVCVFVSSLDWFYQHQLIGTRSKQNSQNEEVTAEHEA